VGVSEGLITSIFRVENEPGALSQKMATFIYLCLRVLLMMVSISEGCRASGSKILSFL
jgi:hypothetical protein